VTDFSSIPGGILSALVPSPGYWEWRGISTRWFRHQIFPFSRAISVKNAHYIIARRKSEASCAGLYNGETEDTATRFPTHKKFLEAAFYGANEIHICVIPDSAVRFAVETDIRQLHQMPLNDQPIPAGLLGPLPFSLLGALSPRRR
jgi:hypothetical protein